jgi:hypothetical protein
MKHSPQWYMALGRSLGHPDYVTLAEIQDAERELAEEGAVSAS